MIKKNKKVIQIKIKKKSGIYLLFKKNKKKKKKNTWNKKLVKLNKYMPVTGK